MIRSNRWAQSGLKWASLLAGIAALWMSYGINGAPYITNDGYQYLDAAANLSSGQCFCTNVVVFDEQVAYGRLPVPFTHFAPGYPLLIAGMSRMGIAGERAGYLLSAFGFLGVLWLIWDVGLTLGAKPWVVAAFALQWIVHVTALYYAAVVGTESLFAALFLGTVALIARDVQAGHHAIRLPLWLGIIAGLSYWIRYPGLFLVAGAGLYLLVRAVRSPQGRSGAVAGLMASVILAGSVQIRNAVYSGSWRGGFTLGSNHSVRTALTDSTRSVIHLIIGDRLPTRFDGWLAAILVPCVVLFFAGISAWRRRSREAAGSQEALGWAVFIGLAYCGGVLIATLTTIAADLPRYYFPVYPLILVCLAVACSKVARGLVSLAVVLLAIAVAADQSRGFRVPVPPPDWILTRDILREEVQPPTSLLDWLHDHMGPQDTLLAVEGQAVHYLLQRPVIAIIPTRDTTRRTDDQGVRSLMLQRHMRWLLVFPGAPGDRVPEQNSNPFLRTVAAGDAPQWLRLAARTRDAAVYECTECAN